MSGLAMAYAFEAAGASKLHGPAWRVLWSLSYHANAYTGRSTPSSETIGQQVGLDPGNVRRAFVQIRAAGILVNIRRRGCSDLWIFPETARATARGEHTDPARNGTPPRAESRETPRASDARTCTALNLDASAAPPPVDSCAMGGDCGGTGWVWQGSGVVTACLCRTQARGKVAGRSRERCAETPDAEPATADRTRPRPSSRPSTPATSPPTPTSGPDGSPRSEPSSASPVLVTLSSAAL